MVEDRYRRRARQPELSTKGLSRKANWTFRRATASLRSLPEFIIIGAPRSGTTSLWDHLGQHPDVIPAFRKEVHYFDYHYERGQSWYRAHFPIARRMPAGAITGEATPNYMGQPGVAERVHETMPDVRLVVLLRNPIDRAHSAWQLKTRKGLETLPFDEALKAEGSRLGTKGHRSTPDLRYAYLGKSRYAEQLAAWFNLFPREQFAVYKSEEVFTGDLGVMADLYRFLGLAQEPLVDRALPKANAAPRPAQIDDGVRHELAGYFAEQNRQLYAILGRDLGWN